MPALPPAEVDVTVDLARGLLAAQHPDLAERPLVVAAHGWDNVVLRLGDDLALRLPRRAAAAELVRHELEWLPRLAPRLPVPVPAPLRAGRPSDGSRGPAYPWAWSVVPWFDGRPAWAVPPAARSGLVASLARFVAALHRPAPADAPANPFRGVALGERDAAVRARLRGDDVPGAAALLALWARLVETPAWDGPAVWLHGDLHPANLVATGGDARPATLAAVVDFGDLTAGDPATDLATAWLTFDGPGRAVFRRRVTAACGTDDATWDRARAWAVALAAMLLRHSADEAPHLRAMGEHARDQVLAGT
ncbi:aminoglycoside phosphotransferase family protein [Cellulosimicrobium sp. CUA-896]|uniref:aminoglycoside phosphotransferase family protein n=1 Tax=Cellulosimicrobium sp. CUA-896 TaxID=1517881 RepID=UPI000959CCD7|nr:aminoglycoside phosphotransferase family protein [Cellulosimicrobium sp. CUA-896]OLT53121.1 phosphotransferase [Cellulosimicrobium sp. CUA-896]